MNEDTEDIWRKAVAEWCVINWCDGMEHCQTVDEALMHLHKMMQQDFADRVDPLINGGYEFRKLPSQLPKFCNNPQYETHRKHNSYIW